MSGSNLPLARHLSYTMPMRYALLILALIAMPSRSGEFISGSTSCPSSGNARVAAASNNFYQLTVSAPTTNAGRIHVGGSTVSTSTGGWLVAGASYTASKPNSGISPSTLYFACTNTADGVSWVGSK